MRAGVYWLLAGWLAVVVPAAAQDWQKELTSQPGSFPLLRPVKAHYRFGWALVNAAEADFHYRQEKGIGRMKVSTATIGVARGLWRMDAIHEATMALAGLHPLTMVHTETEKDGTEETRLTFVPEGVQRVRESKPPGPKPAKTKKFKFPGVMDLHTALHFIRSQPLKTNDVYKFVVYPMTSPYLAQVSVLGTERLKVAGSTYDAYKLDLKLWSITEEMKLEPHQKFKKATAWISNDANRMFLRVESEIFVGSVWGELESVSYE